MDTTLLAFPLFPISLGLDRRTHILPVPGGAMMWKQKRVARPHFSSFFPSTLIARGGYS